MSRPQGTWEIVIDAPVADVWSVLDDSSNLPPAEADPVGRLEPSAEAVRPHDWSKLPLNSQFATHNFLVSPTPTAGLARRARRGG